MHDWSTPYPKASAARRAANCLTVLVLGGLLVFLSACSQVVPPVERNFINPESPPQLSMRVAVVPFQNLSTHGNAGLITAQLITSELYSAGVFKLLEESKVRQILAKERISPEDVEATTEAHAIAELLDVEAVIVGSVSEFGYKHSLKEEPAVGLNLRLIRRGDGQILWAASHSETGSDRQRQSLNQLAQRIIGRMIQALKTDPALTN